MEGNVSITPDELRRVLALLKATFTHLVIDVSKSFGPLDIAAMESSNQVLLVTQLDLPCLRNVVRLMQSLETRDALHDKIKVVVNRLGLEDTQISLNKALETIGHEIFWQIPNDYATMVESRNNGVPLIAQAPRAKLTKSIEQLAQAVDKGGQKPEEEEAGKKPAKKGFFSFLGSK
jgi:pilus assembly protein CpaE